MGTFILELNPTLSTPLSSILLTNGFGGATTTVFYSSTINFDSILGVVVIVPVWVIVTLGS